MQSVDRWGGEKGTDSGWGWRCPWILKKNMKVKNGAVFLAEKAKVKIVPVGIKGSFKPFTKVIFNYGKPINIEDFKNGDPDWLDKASMKVMDDIVMLTKNVD